MCAASGLFNINILNFLSEYDKFVTFNMLFQVVIVAPTRELTIQIFNEARKFSYGSILKIAVAYGGTAVRHQGDNISVSRNRYYSTYEILNLKKRGFFFFLYVCL